MISYEAYKVIHLLAVLMLFAGLGGAMLLAMNGGEPSPAARRAVSILHSAGLLIILVAGLGLVARLDLMSGGIPPWVFGKLGVWLLAGLVLTIPRRRPAWARPMLWFGLPFLAVAAAWLAVYKPGN